MRNPTVNVEEKHMYQRVEVKDYRGKVLFTMQITNEGCWITGNADQGDMVVKPRNGNEIVVTYAYPKLV